MEILVNWTRPHFFIGVSKVPVKLIALALLTSMSIPPNVFTASCTALLTAFSSRISTAQGRHFPPASSTAARNNVWITYQYHENFFKGLSKMILEISTEIMSPRLQFEEVMRILLSTYKIKEPDIWKIMIVTSVCITPLEVTHFINSVTVVSDKNYTLAATTKTKGSPSFAAVYMVPGSFGWGSVVLAAIKMFAPSWAAFSAMAFPMPRLAPVINNVLPAKFLPNVGWRQYRYHNEQKKNQNESKQEIVRSNEGRLASFFTWSKTYPVFFNIFPSIEPSKDTTCGWL